MKKIIIIKDKHYTIECNALSYILYKKIFNKDILQDIQILQNYVIEQAVKTEEIKERFQNISQVELIKKVVNYMKKYADDFAQAIMRITYTLICTYNDMFVDFETFLRSVKEINVEDNWVADVIEIAIDSFIDVDVIKELKKMPGDTTEVLFPEHFFILACLRVGLTLEDLKFLTYLDVMKIFLSIEAKKEDSKVRKATQADIDKFLM